MIKEYRVITGFSGMFGFGGPITSCGVTYLAFQEEKGTLIEERGRILLPCDEELYRSLAKQINRASVVIVLGEKEDDVINAREITNTQAEPSPEEADFLYRISLPVTFVDELGEFTLDRQLNWFKGKIISQDRELSVTLDNKEDIETLRKIHQEMDIFLEKAAVFAAEELLDLANDWGEDGWDEKEKGSAFVPLTHTDFIDCMFLQSINILEDGCYSLWYDDGDMFWGHSICVDGSLSKGFNSATIQG